MSSPIHKFLFSPPASPPTRAVDENSLDPNRHFTSIKSLLLPTDFSLDASTSTASPKLGNLTRSPRTPQQKFTLDGAYPSPSNYPSRRTLVNATTTTPKTSVVTTTTIDVDATPRSSRNLHGLSINTTPRRAPISEKALLASPPIQLANIPSSPLPSISTGLPKPFLRILFLLALLLSSTALLIFVPGARLPSLRAASVSRRLALDESGRAFLDLQSGGADSWSAARDRDYIPPQVRTGRLQRRMAEALAEPEPVPAPAPIPAPIASHPRATRPTISRPLPPTHELLALQSYVLDSPYNVLPAGTDPSIPLDANLVLGVSLAAHRHSHINSPAPEDWLDEIAKEHADNVIVWYGGDGSATHPHYVLDVLSSLHGEARHPTLVPCHNRADRDILNGVFSRLGANLASSPVVVVGNEVISATKENIDALLASGELKAILRRAGWIRSETTRKPAGRALKQAKWVKRQVTEVEAAAQAAKK